MDLKKYEIDPVRGFLPAKDPLRELPDTYRVWEDAAGQLPKLIVSNQLRKNLAAMPVLKPEALKTKPGLERAMMLLSYLGHAYVWGEQSVVDTVPESIAIPWHAVAQELGRPPVLSYASYALHNWRRIDPAGPIECGNIGLLQNFMAGADEEWFILIHIDIEAKAAPAVTSIPALLEARDNKDERALLEALRTVGESLGAVNQVMNRMPEWCDPYIYYRRVRPYIHGWKDNPALPNGVIYEGVSAYGGVPQKFRGETGAQSAIVPSLDAVLGVTHADDPLKQFLMEMREYMPPAHLRFVEAVEQAGSIRDYVERCAAASPDILAEYNRCISELTTFRTTHLRYAGDYIDSQKQTSEANPTKVGTGGTPFMVYLKKHRDETDTHSM